MTKAIGLYMPVIHQGYIALLERHYPADIVLITSEGFKSIDPVIADQLSRDIRCIPAEEVGAYLLLKFPGLRIRIFEDIEYLRQFKKIIMPDEDVSHALIEKLPGIEIVLDNQFLRWDWRNTNIPKEVVADFAITTDDLHEQFMKDTQLNAEKSSDFWRQVGALISLKPGFLVAYNKHMPTAMEPYIHGDMRLIMKPGEQPEICGALHAEKAVFAKALRQGISLYGKDMYVTTFPCLPCAQMIAAVGIKRLFFREGYSNQHAAEVLQKGGIEIIQVK